MMKATLYSSTSRPCSGTDGRKQMGRRLHLPVAPRANSRMRFGPTEKSMPAMMPEEALAWLEDVLRQGIKIEVVAITGPGDPLAVVGPTMETLRLVRRKYPDISLSLSTLGIGGDRYAETLADIGVSHVTILVDAVAPEVAEKLYAWIRPGTRTVPLPKAAGMLLDEQARAVTAFKQAGLAVKINTTVYPGHNAEHVEEIAESMAALGAETMSVEPFEPEAGDDENVPRRPGTELMDTVRGRASKYIEIVEDCEKPKAGLPDAIFLKSCKDSTAMLPKPSGERPNVAVVSSNGMDVDLHLGHAIKALIYGPREDGLPCLLGTRWLPEPGGGSSRWENLADTLSDCFALLTASAGASPREILSRRGIRVLISDENVEGTVDVLYGGGKKGKKCRT
jgi:nitrogen fixation protein NifB